MEIVGLREFIAFLMAAYRRRRDNVASPYQQISRRLRTLDEKHARFSVGIITPLFKNVQLYRKELERISTCVAGRIAFTVPAENPKETTVQLWFVDSRGMYIHEEEMLLFRDAAIHLLDLLDKEGVYEALNSKSQMHLQRVVQNLDCLSKEFN